MTTLPSESIVSQPIARAFLDRSPLIAQRFPQQIVDADFCATRARHGASRSRLVELVAASMSNLSLSDEQNAALAVLRSPLSVATVTGQQIGLFGGPMYTIYKIRTAVEEARRVQEQTGVETVALFWLEDNDHDAAEASSAHLLDADGAVVDIDTWDKTDDRKSVSARSVDAAMYERITTAAALITGQHADAVRERYSEAYSNGALWADAFLAILQPYLAPWGVLVVRGSKVIESGLHLPILLRDVEQPGQLGAVLAAGTKTIEELGFTPQANVGSQAFFGSDDTGRQKIVVTDELLALAKEQPHRFTPGVLARPIVQDAILPTVVSVLGAAEIAYHAQLREAYEFCGVQMPMIVLRNGATLLDARTERLLSKDGHDVAWFMRTPDELERAIADVLTTNVIPAVELRNELLGALLAPYLTAAETIDQTLVATVRAQGAGVTSTLEALEGKLRSAAKRTQTLVVDRIRSIHALVSPRGVLQERVFPLAFWEARFGNTDLRIIVEHIARAPIGSHAVIGLSDLST
ncbi:MAG: bacillithiol biosynthesis cysteine-adding enzyme BshC [Candidatus Kapabacteria bacterium]|nr:bacillithiol biosynthesis cysteine-adding enzyme BshC [Candidatus Kapabacteria bacterium]